MPYLCDTPGPVILYDHVESLYFLEAFNFNPNTHSPIHAVRIHFNGAVDTKLLQCPTQRFRILPYSHIGGRRVTRGDDECE